MKSWPGWILIVMGIVLAALGLSSAPHGNVLGGTPVLVLFYGGCLFFVVSGILVLRFGKKG